MFRAKNQYDKMEEKKLCGAEKNNIPQQKDKGMWREKRMYRGMEE